MTIKCLTPAQIARVFDVTDSLGLHRNWVVIPLAAADNPIELIMPDGKLLLRPPGGTAFDPWIADLKSRLENLDLERTPMSGQHESYKPTVPADAPTGSGGRRLYLQWQEEDEEKAD